MDKQKALYYIENSFLASLLREEDITDISYNGKDIYYVSNIEGRKKSDIVIEHQAAKDFIRQIANIAEKQFSFTSPQLDISIGRYRINAMHQSIGRIADEGVVTFCIRIASGEMRINSFSDFFTRDIVVLLREILRNRSSIVIGGVTSSGKTEFQKYLLLNMRENERVIVIDNVLELDQIRNEYLDLTCWQVNDDSPYSNASSLIRNALRNNPDWLILAEARGEEMVDVLNSAMTGLPIITTVHSLDADSLPHRMGRMMMKSKQKIDFNEALIDIHYHFHFYFYLTKVENENGVKRYVSQINYVNNKGEITTLFKREENTYEYSQLTEDIKTALKIREDSLLYDTSFLRKENSNNE